jgi:transposase
MNFYTRQHAYYCGIDLHARTMYVCVQNQAGEVLVHRNIDSDRNQFLALIAPYREDIVVAVECLFLWYWLADLCADENIPLALGHALYMRAIHGAKTKNDRVDAHKITSLLRGGLLPLSYVYPANLRATRDLLRRRNHFNRKRAELLSHIQNTVSQYNLPPLDGNPRYKKHREAVPGHFPDPQVRALVELDLDLINHYDALLAKLELHLIHNAKIHNPRTYQLLKTVPGVGPILALVLLYEIHDIHRFPTVQDFLSYCRLVTCSKESAGKRLGSSGKKIGNAHLKWAFSEAATLFLRGNPEGKALLERLRRKHGKAKAKGILAAKIGRAVYFMLRRKEAFDATKLIAA